MYINYFAISVLVISKVDCISLSISLENVLMLTRDGDGAG